MTSSSATRSSSRTLTRLRNKNEQLKKETVLKSIEEDAELLQQHDDGHHHNHSSSSGGLDLSKPSHIEAIVMDVREEIERRKDVVRRMRREGNIHLKQLCRVQINSLPKDLQNMTLADFEQSSGMDVYALAKDSCMAEFMKKNKRSLSSSGEDIMPMVNVGKERPKMETPVPTSGAGRSLFAAMTPAATVRKQRKGEKVKDAVLMGISENGSPIEIDIESEVAAMTIAATVKQKRRRLNVFGDKLTSKSNVNASLPINVMPTEEDLAKLDPGMRAQISGLYQNFVGQVGSIISGIKE